MQKGITCNMEKDVLKAIIKTATIKSIINFTDRTLKKKSNFQILDLLMPKERKIRSIVGGMETSMGTTLWEPLAKEIAKANGFTVVNEKLKKPTIMPASLDATLGLIRNDRQNYTNSFNAESSHQAIKNVCQPFLVNRITEFSKAPTGSGVDIWLFKDGVDWFFDTKTVQPNVGDFKKFLDQIMNWYAYYYSNKPDGHAEGRIVFPYNPYDGDFWDKTKAGARPLTPGLEAWVEDDFWDFLSGYAGTFHLIKESFAEINQERTLEASLDKIFDRNASIITPDPDEV